MADESADTEHPSGVEPIQQASESLSEFQRRLARYKRKPTDNAVWEAIDDLGRQVSAVRHDLGNFKTTYDGMDMRLFGFRSPDGSRNGGGAFGDLKRGQSSLIDRLESKLDRQTEELKTSLDTRVAKVESTVGWITRIAGFVLAIASGVAVLVIAAHFLH